MRELGVVVDLENLEGAMGGLVGLLRRLDPDGVQVVLVGTAWAQAEADRYRLADVWRGVAERIENDREPEAADRLINDVIDDWRLDGRVVVLASRDGGFDRMMRRCVDRGVPAFVVGFEGTAVRLRDVVPVLDVSDPDHVAESVARITAARRA